MENIIDAKKDTQWKAWIDTDNNVLNVEGQLKIKDRELAYELGKTEQGYLKDELLLAITPKLATGNQMVTVKYQEKLQGQHPYKKVTIKSGAEEVASLPIK